MHKNKKDKRSPLKTKALREPGQSLTEQLDELLFSKIMLWCMLCLFCISFAALEWYRMYHPRPPWPIGYTVIAFIALCITAWKICKLLPLLRAIRLGISGEKIVGQCLEKLRAQGYEVFHDIIGDGYNIDHALVGPGGVYAIETKTASKPIKGCCEVVFDGEHITVDGFTPDRNPVIQVKAVARNLSSIIHDTTGRDLFVKPTVIYPGWFVRQTSESNIWVLNEKALPKFLANEPIRLKPDEITNIASGIAMYVRNTKVD